MANKRIKDLSTTAAVTASDDFIAVDGATNGTRKLDAYSPTFGGNLTVSGTGTSSVAGTLNVSGGFILNRINAKGIYTGTSDNCGFTWTGTNGEFSTASGSLILKSAGTTALTLDASQNATFAKTISAGTTITANGANTDVAIGVTMTGANARAWQWRIDSTTGNLRLLDATASSYPITFLGNAAGVTIGSQYNGGLTANTQSYGSHVFQCANVDKLTVADTKITISPTTASTSTTTGALVVSGGVGVAGAVNVGGAIAIGNTVQTAASVASTHKVTVVIGGVTYYLLATNV